MIKVNLLPPECRKVERTPMLRFATIVAGVVLSASAIGAFLYVHFGMLVNVVSEREKLEDIFATEKAKADQSRALAQEAKEYKARRDEIERIGQERRLWSRKIDELCDIIQNKGDRKRHLVWLTQFRTLPASRGTPGGVYIKGYSGGSEIHRLSDFHLDVVNSEFFRDFASIDNPEGSVVMFPGDRVPDTAWEFDFNMLFQPQAKKR